MLGGPDERLVDVNHTEGMAHGHQQEFHGQAAEGERMGEVFIDGDEAAGAMSGKNGGRASLNIGFIGHDFHEHPTAHMIEGVFVWQKRLSGIKHEELVFSEALEARGKGNPEEQPAKIRTTPTAAAECCR